MYGVNHYSEKTFNVINYRNEGENNDRNSKPYDLKGRSLLKESDFTKAEFREGTY